MMNRPILILLSISLISISAGTSTAAELPKMHVIYDTKDMVEVWQMKAEEKPVREFTTEEIVGRLRASFHNQQLDMQQLPLEKIVSTYYPQTKSIIVSANQLEHDRLADYLVHLRQTDFAQIHTRFRFLSVTNEALQQANLAYTKVETFPDTGPIGIVEFSAEQLQQFLTLIEQDKSTKRIASPLIKSYSGQQTSLISGGEHSFLTSAQSTPQNEIQTGTSILKTGLEITHTATARQEGKIELNFEAVIGSLKNKAEVDVRDVMLNTPNGKAVPVQVQVPETQQLKARANHQLNSGNSLLLVCLKGEPPVEQPANELLNLPLSAVGPAVRHYHNVGYPPE